MKLVTFRYRDTERVGVLDRTEGYVYPAADAGLPYASMLELIRQAPKEELDALRALGDAPADLVSGALAIETVRLLAPIPHPAQDIICLGINYLDHAEESRRFHGGAFGTERPLPIYFSKRVNRAVAHDEPIPAHADLTDSLDYEAELAVVIGRDASRVPEKDATDYIFGYTILNDVSARNIQTGHQQWYFGKSLDGFAPIGPCIATIDAFSFPPALKISSRVNGEPRQDSNTRLLITGIAAIIAELSQGMTLRAGTIIATGTPSGVGMGFQPSKFLKPGDIVSCSIESIGTLTNSIE